MQRISLLFSLFVISFSFLLHPGVGAANQEDDKKAAEQVVRSFEQAVQEYDFDKADSLLTPDAHWIEFGYPTPVEPWLRQVFQKFKDAKVRIDYHPQDAEVHVSGDVAWVTITLNTTLEAGPGAPLPNGRNHAHAIYVESEILVRTPGGWKIVLGHTTHLPVSFGASPDWTRQHDGMRFADVEPGGVADKAGFKAGDVMVQFGCQKIDSPGDFLRIMRGPFRGDNVTVTVMRGEEKITKEVTLDGAR
jgi:ketosteroid isomerase-like protein